MCIENKEKKVLANCVEKIKKKKDQRHTPHLAGCVINFEQFLFYKSKHTM